MCELSNRSVLGNRCATLPTRLVLENRCVTLPSHRARDDNIAWLHNRYCQLRADTSPTARCVPPCVEEQTGNRILANLLFFEDSESTDPKRSTPNKRHVDEIGEIWYW
ncbi:hypothetical protein JTB14_002847 [Gonioctena quinquepunctata]|nr:hypothetical protein JTB14_002847 [Gonioctena quinquepunctata]